MKITKVIEFDAGHRIPNHDSKCRNIHGHRYRVECTFEGNIRPDRGQSDAGMVVDFSVLKDILTTEIHDVYDHGFIVYEKDSFLVAALSGFQKSVEPVTKVLHVPFIPTAENLSVLFMTKVNEKLQDHYGDRVVVSRLRLYETPNSWADATPQDSLT